MAAAHRKREKTMRSRSSRYWVCVTWLAQKFPRESDAADMNFVSIYGVLFFRACCFFSSIPITSPALSLSLSLSCSVCNVRPWCLSISLSLLVLLFVFAFFPLFRRYAVCILRFPFPASRCSGWREKRDPVQQFAAQYRFMHNSCSSQHNIYRPQ